MKSGLKYIDKAILLEIGKIIEQEEDEEKTDADVLDTFDKMDTFVTNEKEQSDAAVKNSMKLMSTLSEPIKRNAEGLNMKVQKDRIKKLDTMKKSVEDQKKNFEDNLKKRQILAKSQTNANAQMSPQSFMTEMIKDTIKKISLPMITRKFFTEQGNLPSNQAGQGNGAPKNKAYLVKFDQDTQRPFDVKFTERGFAIEGTRLSFEAIENALSKNYTITLNNGKGLMLDAIKMQKILRYKGNYPQWFPNAK